MGKRILQCLVCVSFLLLLCACDSEGNRAENQTVNTEPTDFVIREPPPIENLEYYENPIIKVGDKNTWPVYGVGDPFVMRYNGRYYLYCSTKDDEIGIQCWVSDDLITWEYTGLCATEAVTKSAFAPEVVYYNGSFYMYTSPGGNGHYVLKSDSPSGPFVAVTDNFGLSIDGNVLIDDDGAWYFYSAAYNGIMRYTMSAPDKVNVDSGVMIPCDLHGWTEGSMIVKYGGLYYMTYAGNHVWSAGYRINYAISDRSPVEFEHVDNNPLLLSTDKQTVMGIGHSSTVLGPNLDEYYIVYHSFKDAPRRNMNIDRIVFNGTGTVVLGATTEEQQAPSMPDLYSRFESEEDLLTWSVENGEFDQGELVLQKGGLLLSKQKFEGNYTAEFNLKTISDSAGVVFDYLDDNNYAKAVYHGQLGILAVSYVVNGAETREDIPISASFGDKLKADALISFTIRKAENNYTLFVNNREVFSSDKVLPGGTLGVTCESGMTSVGFVGITAGVWQSTLSDVYKPAESSIPAFTCTNDDVQIKTYNRANYLAAVNGVSYEYKANVSCGGIYDFVVEYISSESCVLEVYQNDMCVGEVNLPNSENDLSRIAVRCLTLATGSGNITLRIHEGCASLLNFSFHKAEEVTEMTCDFSGSMRYSYKDGKWKIEDERLVLDGEYGKYMVGSENWGNYTVESDITITTNNADAGLCVRVSNPATHEVDRIAEGSNYLQGYYVGLVNGSLVLGKQNYDYQELNRVFFNTKKGKTYHLAVEVWENEIRVWIDGELLMTYTDTDAPFLHGMVGYRAHSCSVWVDNLKISPI